MNAQVRVDSQAPSIDLPYIFAGVQVFRRDTAFVRGVLKRLDEAQIAHAFVVQWNNGVWKPYMIQSGVTAQCIRDCGYWEVFSLSPEGSVHIATPTSMAVEQIDPSEDGPSTLRWMLDIACIGRSVFVTGMARSVYQRTEPNRWTRANRGAEVTGVEEIESGFRSICGLDEGQILAVGFQGEIWERNDQLWHRVDSPTNVALHCVRYLADGRAFACGAAGVILKMVGGKWSVIDHDQTSEDFWSLQEFRDQVYLSSSNSIYRLNSDEALTKVDLALPTKPTSGYLHANDGVLWSAGYRDLLMFDGQTWIPIIPPPAPAPPQHERKAMTGNE